MRYLQHDDVTCFDGWIEPQPKKPGGFRHNFPDQCSGLGDDSGTAYGALQMRVCVVRNNCARNYCDPFDSYIAADNEQYRNDQDEASSDGDRKLFSSRGQWHLINMVRREI